MEKRYLYESPGILGSDKYLNGGCFGRGGVFVKKAQNFHFFQIFSVFLVNRTAKLCRLNATKCDCGSNSVKHMPRYTSSKKTA